MVHRLFLPDRVERGLRWAKLNIFPTIQLCYIAIIDFYLGVDKRTIKWYSNFQIVIHIHICSSLLTIDNATLMKFKYYTVFLSFILHKKSFNALEKYFRICHCIRNPMCFFSFKFSPCFTLRMPWSMWLWKFPWNENQKNSNL